MTVKFASIRVHSRLLAESFRLSEDLCKLVVQFSFCFGNPFRTMRNIVAALMLLSTTCSIHAASPRWVSLSPSLTELVFDLGLSSNLVGRSSACDQPAGAAAIPVAGDFGRPNLEVVSTIKPDAVLVTDLERPAIKASLAELGVETLVLPCESWEALERAALHLSQLAGQEEQGIQWVARLQERRENIRTRAQTAFEGRKRPSVFVEIWKDPVTTTGTNSFLNAVVHTAGGIPLGDELSSPYAHVSSEWIIERNPDVILVAYMTASGAGATVDIAQRMGWDGIRAVQDNRICDTIPPDLLLRPGPHLIDGTERLADWLIEHFGSP